MKLSLPSFIGKKEQPEYLLALLLHDDKVKAIVFEQFSGKINIIGKHQESFETTLEHAPIDEWLDILDKTISKAEETLPANVETHKTVFGVKETWVEDKKIKKERLATLKKVCDALNLTPIGFLVIPETITHLLQEEEGAPVSSLLALIGKKSITVSLIRAGRIIETKSIHDFEESHVKAVDTLLKHFTGVEVLPSRLIIFGDKGDELAQEFISHLWSKSLPFLHMPQISVLPPDFDARAVVYGAASQMGLEVLDTILQKDAKDIKTYHSKKEKDHEPTLESLPADNFGFVMDEDIAKKLHTPEKEEEKTHEQSDEKPGHRIVPHTAHIDQEVTHAVPKAYDNLRHVPDEEIESRDERLHNAENPSEKKQSFLSVLSPIGGILSLPMKGMKNLPTMIGRGGKMVLIIPLVILLLVGIVALYIFHLKATIAIDIKPKAIEQEETLTFSLSSPNDFSQKIIAAKDITVDLEGKASTQVTGKKEVGNKAKGTVTIYNNFDTKKTLSSGTVIASGNSLDFTLDKEISVGSASGDIFSGTKPGTAQGAVTASKIGTEYNLPSGTKFTVDGSSSIAAKNDGAFSGGTKKEVTIVAKKDVTKVTDELPKSLQDKAKEEIGKKINPDEEVLPFYDNVELSKKKLDRNEGDEAKIVTLNATATFTYFTYKKDDLEQFAQTIVKNRLGDDNTISDTGISTTLKDIKDGDDKKASAKVTISGGIMPKLDTTKLKKDIAGKSFEEAKDMITKLPQVENVDIRLAPPIPFLPKILPRLSNNIVISIKTNE